MGHHKRVRLTMQDQPILLKQEPQSRKLTCGEYLPFVALGIVLVGLFVQVLIPQLIH